jgi:hypothetical protein
MYISISQNIPIQSHAFPPKIHEIPSTSVISSGQRRKALRLRDGWPVISVGAPVMGNLETIIQNGVRKTLDHQII